MARPTSRFVCQGCGEAFLRWEGQCRACGAWNSLVETVVRDTPRAVRGPNPAVDAAAPVALTDIGESDVPRLATGIAELDRVLGGGLVPGSLVLVGGEPGIGKSTLLLQAAAGMGRPVLYATGEESAAQVRIRAGRLGLLGVPAGAAIEVLADHDVGRIVEVGRSMRPALVVVDSIQTATVDELDGAAGSLGQVREATLRLMEFAKGESIACVLVGHVTKDGSIAGPRTLEHVVDTVIQFEGDRHHAHRILRALKNRFGPADEIGVFSMGESGLRGVPNPSEVFLAERAPGAPGSAVLAVIEGSRPLLVEVQALVGETAYGSPRRVALGVDAGRLAMILAVLARRAGIEVGGRDVFVNVAGGLETHEPAADLAVALAASSSLTGRPLAERTTILGEIGLAGEIRSVSRLDARLREAGRLGFDTAIVPAGGAMAASSGLRVVAVRHLAEALVAANVA